MERGGEGRGREGGEEIAVNGVIGWGSCFGGCLGQLSCVFFFFWGGGWGGLGVLYLLRTKRFKKKWGTIVVLFTEQQ